MPEFLRENHLVAWALTSQYLQLFTFPAQCLVQSISRSWLFHPQIMLPKLPPHLSCITTNLAHTTTMTDPQVTLAPLLDSLSPFCTQWPGKLRLLLRPSLGPIPVPKALFHHPKHMPVLLGVMELPQPMIFLSILSKVGKSHFESHFTNLEIRNQIFSLLCS